MFTPEDRNRLRHLLTAAARGDDRVTSAALTGSSALATEDRWSDIDLALSLAAEANRPQAIADWTQLMYREHKAIHHVDVTWGNVLFRVFLLASTLQVDIAFWPADEFGAIAPSFRLLFGTAHERPGPPAPAAAGLIGMGWLYALHARASIARKRFWQAEYMISGERDNVLALACLRHGVPAGQARGIDSLPAESTSAIVESLVRSLELTEIRRAFSAVNDALIAEIKQTDPDLASRLAGPLRELTQRAE